MSKKDDIRHFLEQFKMKMRVFDVIFRDERGKNTQALLDLEISPIERKDILNDLEITDYCEGPVEDNLYNISDMWVFGKRVKDRDVYIKISLGLQNHSVICISFHPPEKPLEYEFK